jgi:hypothetical protein
MREQRKPLLVLKIERCLPIRNVRHRLNFKVAFCRVVDVKRSPDRLVWIGSGKIGITQILRISQGNPSDAIDRHSAIVDQPPTARGKKRPVRVMYARYSSATGLPSNFRSSNLDVYQRIPYDATAAAAVIQLGKSSATPVLVRM